VTAAAAGAAAGGYVGRSGGGWLPITGIALGMFLMLAGALISVGKLLEWKAARTRPGNEE
jgi:hypothetical protein